jgi:hypothetical protein
MMRHAEIEAKRKDTRRLSYPGSDIVGTDDRDERNEAEERREIDQEGMARKDPTENDPEPTKVKRPEPGPGSP